MKGDALRNGCKSEAVAGFEHVPYLQGTSLEVLHFHLLRAQETNGHGYQSMADTDERQI